MNAKNIEFKLKGSNILGLNVVFKHFGNRFIGMSIISCLCTAGLPHLSLKLLGMAAGLEIGSGHI